MIINIILNLLQKMVDSQDIKTNFSFRECELLIRIIGVEDKPYLTQVQLANEIGIAYSSPIYRSILKYLESQEIIKSQQTIGNAKLIVIDYKKLRDLIDEQKVVQLFYNYLNEWHLCKW